MKIETLKELIGLMREREAFYLSLPEPLIDAFFGNESVVAMDRALDLLVRELCNDDAKAEYCKWLMFEFNEGCSNLYVDRFGNEHSFKTTDEVLAYLDQSGLWEGGNL
jgi:hypothetical protein